MPRARASSSDQLQDPVAVIHLVLRRWANECGPNQKYTESPVRTGEVFPGFHKQLRHAWVSSNNTLAITCQRRLMTCNGWVTASSLPVADAIALAERDSEGS